MGRRPNPTLEQLFVEEGEELGFVDAALFGGVAVAQGEGLAFLFDGVEVDGDAPGGADLVLATVATADGSALVPEDVVATLQFLVELFGNFHELGLIFDKWEDGDLVRGDAWVELHQATLFAADFVFGVGGSEDGEEEAIDAERGLDDVGDELLLGGFVEDLHGLARVLLMLAEVEVAAGGDAPELLFAEGELEGDVGAGLGVMGELFVHVLAEHLFRQADGDEPVPAVLDPVLVSFGPIDVRGDEVFDLHLLEFAGAEDEVARGDLVAEGLTDLGDAERNLYAAGVDDVFVVGEDALGSFWAKVGGGGVVRKGADLGFKHEVEVAGSGQATWLAGGGRGDELVLGRVGVDVLLEHDGLELALHGGFTLELVGLLFGFGLHGSVFEDGDVADGFAGDLDGGEEKLVGAVAHFRLLAVDHGVGEAADVAGCDPDLWVHDDGGVEADDVFAAVDHVLPPGVFDVLLNLGAEGAEVEESIVSAVDFG